MASQQLSFRYYFNQAIVGAVWPASLQQLSFNRLYFQSAKQTAQLASLRLLMVGGQEYEFLEVGVVHPFFGTQVDPFVSAFRRIDEG